MKAPSPRRFVITGGPGTGKSTLLEYAATAGFTVSREVAREILQEPGGMDLREFDPVGFAEAMLTREIEAFEVSSASPGPVMFDRGFPDIAGFLELSGLPIPERLDRVCRTVRYEGPIFRTPPWQEIYTTDPERLQTWEEALESDRATSGAWNRYGYNLVDLPFESVGKRLKFVGSLLES